MRFTLSSVLIALAVVSAVASPTGNEVDKRSTATKPGRCNGTSCQVGLYNLACRSGSCTGPGGGDGAHCTIVDYENGSNEAFCPGCSNPSLC
ncbi:uncharacterized protein F4807DRAFT_457278 [Annulohypoxylon truncatum]|uniref:uncharacterized protein n=1 Tax=Annulohypoxylon truncatum TaxID=327061 RepID=UPI0020072E8C|nr:uncharacterized protein F4807DRAFT_457278 [Annulohypoxylon truncatum]KAI1213191.1 hypothetical protein F4807DRAFT_457278 [Annulohypoxylon truncatum]